MKEENSNRIFGVFQSSLLGGLTYYIATNTQSWEKLINHYPLETKIYEGLSLVAATSPLAIEAAEGLVSIVNGTFHPFVGKILEKVGLE